LRGVLLLLVQKSGAAENPTAPGGPTDRVHFIAPGLL
jgi:hypothetical protein